MQGMFTCYKASKINKILGSRARLTGSEGHIWPTRRMMCMPAQGGGRVNTDFFFNFLTLLFMLTEVKRFLCDSIIYFLKKFSYLLIC